MTKLVVVLSVILLTPLAGAAQVELGMDGALQISLPADGDPWAHFSVPWGTLRLGFPREGASFETLIAFQVSHRQDTDAFLALTPGINLPLGDGSRYLRGEALLNLVSEGHSDFGLGAALGMKKRIDDGPSSVRLEAGLNHLFDAEITRLRLLVGLSTILGG